MMIDKAFGSVLKQLRIAKGLSQEEFGLEAHLHRTYISQLERGLKNPSLQTVFRIAHVLDIQPNQLLRLVEETLSHVQPD